MNTRTLICLLAGAATFGTSPAMAQEEGVTIDGDPTSKEYAIPLETARQDAAGGGGEQSGSTGEDGSTPLFGVGVEESDEASAASGGGTSSTKPSSAVEGDEAGAVARTASADAPGELVSSAQPAAATQEVAGLSTAATVGGLALAILVLGVVLGLIARRRGSTA